MNAATRTARKWTVRFGRRSDLVKIIWYDGQGSCSPSPRRLTGATKLIPGANLSGKRGPTQSRTPSWPQTVGDGDIG